MWEILPLPDEGESEILFRDEGDEQCTSATS